MSGRFRRPSPALVISLIALFVALGGSSYAALKVTSKNVANNSLTSIDVRNGSLLRKDFKRGQVPAGARGPQGLPGAPGAPGTNGFGRLEYAFDADVLAPGTGETFLKVPCPAGTYPTGGDAFALDDATGEVSRTAGVIQEDGYTYNQVDGRPDGWYALYRTDNVILPDDTYIGVDAICANASPPTPISKNKNKRKR